MRRDSHGYPLDKAEGWGCVDFNLGLYRSWSGNDSVSVFPTCAFSLGLGSGDSSPGRKCRLPAVDPGVICRPSPTPPTPALHPPLTCSRAASTTSAFLHWGLAKHCPAQGLDACRDTCLKHWSLWCLHGSALRVSALCSGVLLPASSDSPSAAVLRFLFLPHLPHSPVNLR